MDTPAQPSIAQNLLLNCVVLVLPLLFAMIIANEEVQKKRKRTKKHEPREEASSDRAMGFVPLS